MSFIARATSAECVTSSDFVGCFHRWRWGLVAMVWCGSGGVSVFITQGKKCDARWADQTEAISILTETRQGPRSCETTKTLNAV